MIGIPSFSFITGRIRQSFPYPVENRQQAVIENLSKAILSMLLSHKSFMRFSAAAIIDRGISYNELQP